MRRKKKQAHTILQSQILLAIGKKHPLGAIVFNNPVGVVRTRALFAALLKVVDEGVLTRIFQAVGINPQQVISYGLCKGSSDIIGVAYGRFLALEVKVDDDELSEDQQVFFRAVRRCQGLAREVRSIEDALEAVEECKRWTTAK